MKLIKYAIPVLVIWAIMMLNYGECQLQQYRRLDPSILNRLDPSKIAKLSSTLAKGEARQMGLLGFTALGAVMFPILVSLGMASFVSHLPTVFKEFASEFGIPATPPRNFFFYRRKRTAFNDDRWHYILKDSLPVLIKTLEENDLMFKNMH